jgi:DNA repair exonuclease SbcCD ATPase subunit
VTLLHHRARLNRLLAERAGASERVKAEESALWEAQGILRSSLKAQKILQEVAQRIQESVHSQIAGVVTRCLKAVFGPDAYEFRIGFEQKRGRTEAKLSFVRDGQEVSPLGASGGGCVDLAAFALRLACLVLTRPRRRRLLVLDEPFKWLSPGYRELVPDLLTTLARDLKVQMVMATNLPEIETGRVIRLEEKK